jgi:hypothetical protein
MLSKAEVCRRCQCSKATVEENLTAAEYNKRGHPLYSEEDVLEFAATRQEKKELRAIEKAARQANRERYENDPEYKRRVDSRTERRRLNREKRRQKIMSLHPTLRRQWAEKGWLKRLFRKDEVERMLRQ